MSIFDRTLSKREYFLEEPKQTTLIENSSHVPQHESFTTQSASLKSLQTSNKVRTAINFNVSFNRSQTAQSSSKLITSKPSQELKKCFLWNNLVPYWKTVYRSLDQPDLVHAAMCSKTRVDSLEEKDFQITAPCSTDASRIEGKEKRSEWQIMWSGWLKTNSHSAVLRIQCHPNNHPSKHQLERRNLRKLERTLKEEKKPHQDNYEKLRRLACHKNFTQDSPALFKGSTRKY